MPGISTSELESVSASASVSFGAAVVVSRNGSSVAANETVLYLEEGARSPFERNGDTLRRLELD
jgi:hypothetical protein